MIRTLSNKSILIVLAVVLVAGLAWGCSALTEAREPQDPQEHVNPDPPSEDVEVTLYFADWQAQHVTPELRSVTVTDEEELPEALVKQLLVGPKDPHLNRTLPENVQLLSVEVEGEIAYVNFSEEIEEITGSAGQTMALQSLLFSLADLPEIERVQLLVEGKKSLTFAGHAVIEEPLQREAIITYPVILDEERAEWLQERADEGIETFRTQPLEAAQFEGRMAGFTEDDTFELLEESGGYAEVLVTRNGDEYLIELEQPVLQDEDGIWMITGVSEK